MDVYEFQQKIIQQIVNEQDEATMQMIEDYVKEKEAQGECYAARIIPEGKLRYILNLGLTMYNKMINGDVIPVELFHQESYTSLLKRELVDMDKENQKLKNQINMLEHGYTLAADGTPHKEINIISKPMLKDLVNNYTKDKIRVSKIREQFQELFDTDNFSLIYKKDRCDVLDFPDTLDALVRVIQEAFCIKTDDYDTLQDVSDFLLCDTEHLRNNSNAFDMLEKKLNSCGYIFGGNKNEGCK